MDKLNNKIRVSLVDDHKVVWPGLQRLVEACEDMEVVGAASSGEESLEKLETWQPDVAVMDLLLPGGMDGIETTRRVRTLRAATRVVVLTLRPQAGLYKAGRAYPLSFSQATIDRCDSTLTFLTVSFSIDRKI